MTRKSLPLLSLLSLALLYLFVPRAQSQTAPEDNGGVMTCTTDVNGFCTVSHGLGGTPTDVQATPTAPLTASSTTNFSQVQVTNVGPTSFQVRAIRGNGGALAGTAVTFQWHAWRKPAATPTTTTAPAPPVNDDLVPAQGAWLGHYAGPNAPDFTADETQVGRKFDIFRSYEDMSGTFPNTAQATIGQDHFLFYWLAPAIFSPRQDFCWSEITNGSHDAFLTSEANALAAYGRPLFLAFDGEAQGQLGTCDHTADNRGTEADFVAAFRHVHDVIAPIAPKVVWVYQLANNRDASVAGMYPGDADVDWIAFDSYSWGVCGGHNDQFRSFADVVHPMYDFLVAGGFTKPLMLGEFGAHTTYAPGAAGTKADFYQNVAAQLRSDFPRLKAVSDFDRTFTAGSGGATCDTRIDSSPEVLTAYQHSAADPYLNQPHA